MKTAVLFYVSHADDWCISRILKWANAIPDVSRITFCGPAAHQVTDARISPVTVSDTLSLLSALDEAGKLQDGSPNGTKADNMVFAFGDSPFYNADLTLQLYGQHTRYAAEYSFADGYPQGIVPEIICSGTVSILKSLAESEKSAAVASAAKAPVSRECLFNLLKTDINSFEIETLLSPKDFRTWRLDFTMATQEGRLICSRLEEIAFSNGTSEPDALSLCEHAIADTQILHPVPAYYNVQIAGGCGGQKCIHCPYPAMAEKNGCANMHLEDFSAAVEKMAAASETAVVSLSLWGEPFTHPELEQFVAVVLAKPGFSVLIETSLSSWNQDAVDHIAAIPEAAQRVTWICSLDAASEETWSRIHPDAGCSLEEANARAEYIKECFPGRTYVQFVRMNENEHELESFYRGHENRLILKYDDFCKSLPERKPADLSPVLRFPCWHLRRDMAILWNGDVPACRERLDDDIIGNIFTDTIDGIWEKSGKLLKEHVAGNLCEACRNCDEYYTFNF